MKISLYSKDATDSAKVRVGVAETLHTLFQLEGLDDDLCRLLLSEAWSSPARQTRGTIEKVTGFIGSLAG